MEIEEVKDIIANNWNDAVSYWKSRAPQGVDAQKWAEEMADQMERNEFSD